MESTGGFGFIGSVSVPPDPEVIKEVDEINAALNEVAPTAPTGGSGRKNGRTRTRSRRTRRPRTRRGWS